MVAPNTNLVRYSGMLDQPLWGRPNVAVARVGIGSPTGHCWRVIATGNAGPSFTQGLFQVRIPEFKPNQVFTLSAWVKRENWSPGPMALWLEAYASVAQGVPSILQYFLPNGNDGGVGPAAALPGGNLPPWSNVTGGVEHLPEHWERVWVQGISPNVPGAAFDIQLTTVAGLRQGDVGSSVLVGGFALDQGVNVQFADTTTAPRGNEFLPIFDFPYHTVETRYPQNGTQVQFGNSYTFAARASGPPQRVFALDFPTMVWYLDDYTGQVDPSARAQMNMGALDLFYQLAQLSQNFHYMHPMYGQTVVRFAKPLVIPKQLPGGSGAVAPFTVELLEIP